MIEDEQGKRASYVVLEQLMAQIRWEGLKQRYRISSYRNNGKAQHPFLVTSTLDGKLIKVPKNRTLLNNI